MRQVRFFLTFLTVYDILKMKKGAGARKIGGIFMKGLLTMLICAAAVLSVSCGNEETVEASPVFVGTSYAAEDASHVYFLDVSEGPRDKRILVLDRETGEVTETDGKAQIMAFSDGKLYFSETMNEDFLAVDAEALVAEPNSWRLASTRYDKAIFASDISVYGERFAFPATYINGNFSSCALDFSYMEDFVEKQRFIIGYEDGEYYYLIVEPEKILSAGEESDASEVRRVTLTLTRGEEELYELMTTEYGAFSYNTMCAVYGGYVYYPDGDSLVRRRLARDAQAEVIYSDYEEDSDYRSASIPSAYDTGDGFEFVMMARATGLERSDLFAVTADGVYVKDNAGTFYLVVHDGSSVTELAHRYSENEAYFVSSVDGTFKFVDADGNYGAVTP